MPSIVIACPKKEDATPLDFYIWCKDCDKKWPVEDWALEEWNDETFKLTATDISKALTGKHKELKKTHQCKVQ